MYYTEEKSPLGRVRGSRILHCVRHYELASIKIYKYLSDNGDGNAEITDNKIFTLFQKTRRMLTLKICVSFLFNTTQVNIITQLINTDAEEYEKMFLKF